VRDENLLRQLLDTFFRIAETEQDKISMKSDSEALNKITLTEKALA
jgi:hypothetical protein